MCSFPPGVSCRETISSGQTTWRTQIRSVEKSIKLIVKLCHPTADLVILFTCMREKPHPHHTVVHAKRMGDFLSRSTQTQWQRTECPRYLEKSDSVGYGGWVA